MRLYESPFDPNTFTTAAEAVARGRQIYSEPDLRLNPHPELGEAQYPWYFSPTLSVKLNGFNLQERMSQLRGPKIEVGGPTDQYKVLYGIGLPADLTVTNFRNPRYLDLPQVDAANLPYADHSVSALFGSALPHGALTDSGEPIDLRNAFTLEAKRCLEPGGLFIGQLMTEADLQFAVEQGFTPVRVLESEGSLPMTGPYATWDFVMVNETPQPGLQYTYEVVPNATPTAAEFAGGITLQTTVEISPPSPSGDE